MAFEHENGHNAVNFTAGAVNGLRALDGYLLRFSVSYQVPSWKDHYGSVIPVFHNFHARAEIDSPPLRLGHPRPETLLILSPHDFPQKAALLFDLLLPAASIEKLEEYRAGGGLEIVLHLNAECIGERYQTVHDDVRFRISQSEWINALKQMQFGNYLLCEIPIVLGDSDELREVWAAMTEARNLLYNGHYRSAVLECRKAFETTVKHFEIDDSIKRATTMNRESHRSMSKRERFLSLYESAKRATHLGAHPDTNNEVVDYSRREALLVFSVVAAAIAEISERPE